MQHRLLGAFILVAVATLSRDAACQPARHALTNVTVIDGTGAPPREHMTILIQGAEIQAVFPSGSQLIPAGTQMHELAGHYVIPGLVNTHVHLRQLPAAGTRHFDRDAVLEELRRHLYGGVTSVREMVADLDSTPMIARLARDGAIDSPSIYYAALFAGPTFIPPGAGAGGSTGHVTDATLSARIAEAVAAGASGVKIYSDLDSSMVLRIATEARRRGLQVWAHSTVFPTPPSAVVRAGVAGLSHACGLPWEVLPDVPDRFSSRPQFQAAEVSPRDPRFAALFGDMARRGVVLDATMRLYRNPGTHSRGCAPALMVALLRDARTAGVLLSTGTDYFNASSEAYPSLHEEIETLVETGVLTPADAIVAATRNGARAIGIERTHGTVAEGKVADLVVLAENPLENIGALRSVVSVFKDGRMYLREPAPPPRE